MLSFSTDQIIEFVEKAKAGNHMSLEKLVNIFHSDIFRFVYYRTQSKMDSEDLTQEIFLKMMKNVKKLKESNKFRSWLYRIAINHVKDYYRKKKILNIIGFQTDTGELPDHDMESENPGDHYSKKEFQTYLAKYIKELSRNEKNVFILRYLEQLKIREIASVLKKNESTIKTYLYRALKKLSRKQELYEFLKGDIS